MVYRAQCMARDNGQCDWQCVVALALHDICSAQMSNAVSRFYRCTGPRCAQSLNNDPFAFARLLEPLFRLDRIVRNECLAVDVARTGN